MDDLAHPTLEGVLAIHSEVIAAHGGAEGLRDQGLLESAIAAPQATMFGQSVYADVVEVGAAYLFYLCQNHPFLDGNKRTALATCLVFLKENDVLKVTKLDRDAWLALTLDVAASRLDRDQTTERLRALVR